MLLRLVKVSTVEGYDMILNNEKVNNIYKLSMYLGVDVSDIIKAIDQILALRIINDEIYVPTMVSCRVLSDTLNTLPIQRLEPLNITDVVFLGGTACGTTWREEIQDKLQFNTFNPVVEDDLTDEAQQIEMRDIALYKLTVITPQMKSAYAIAGTIEDAILYKDKSIFCYLKKYNNRQFTVDQIKSMDMIANMVRKHGGIVLESLDEIVNYLNFKKQLMLNNNYHIVIEIEK